MFSVAFPPYRLNFCFAIEITLKNWMSLQYLKKVSNETEESKGLCPTIQKDESALFCNSVNSIMSSSKFSFKDLKLISFNFSIKNSCKRARTRGHLIFFSFGTQNQFAYLKVYYIAPINWLKIWTKIEQFNKKRTIARETFTEAVVEMCSVKKVFLTL